MLSLSDGREKFGVIGTLESPNHLVTPGDWIITGVKGELYPCKPDIFEATYAPETKLVAQLVAAQAVPSSVIAGAIFDFAGYLITLPQKAAIHCSEVHDAVPMVKAITEWCKRRNLCTADARVEAWREAIATHPTQQGLDAQTIKHISALSELVRMPNAEHFADAHNAAVRHLRSLAAQAKQGEKE